MSLPYDDIPPQVRRERRRRQRLRTEWDTHQAEYQGSDTPQDIVLQLRQRARRSTTSARIILGFLVLTIVAGLFYYLALPLIRQYLDGQRITLVRREAALEQALANLDEEGEGLRNRLTDALANTGLSLTGDWRRFVQFNGATAYGDGAALAYGEFGTLIRVQASNRTLTTTTEIWTAEEIFDLVHFEGSTALGDEAMLVYGSDGTLVLVDTTTGMQSSLTGDWSTSAEFRGAVPLGDDAVLVYGTRGTLVRVDARTGTPTNLEGKWHGGTVFRGAATLGDDMVLVYGGGGVVVRVDTETATPTSLKGDWSDSVFFSGTIAVADDAVLIHGDAGTLIRVDATTSTPTTLKGNWPDYVFFTGAIALGEDAVVVYGTDGTLVMVDTSTGTSKNLEGPWQDSTLFGGATTIGAEAVLVYGNNGTLVRVDAATRTPTTLKGGWSDTTQFLGSIALRDDARLVYGRSGAMVWVDATTGMPTKLNGDWPDTTRFLDAVALGNDAVLVHGNYGQLVKVDATTGTTTRLTGDWPSETRFEGAITLGTKAVLIYGDNGALVQYPNPFRDHVKDVSPSDEALRNLLDKDLPPQWRQLPEVDAIRTELLYIIAQRSPNLLELDKIKQDIEGLWTGLLPLAQQREEFAEFMRVCRGTPDPEAPDNGAITTACTNAWSQELQRETGNWWQTLAEQVPPGILLLFLLATQGSLYRYNLRMAGFHASRADFLELLMMSSGKRDRISKEDLEKLVNLATAMGADKVEFGKGNLPTDQAVEMAKAIAGRG